MSYHPKTWALFGMTPRQSTVVHTMLDALAREYDVTFPAALREWYTTVNSRDLFFIFTANPPQLTTPLDDLPRQLRAAKQNGHGPYMEVIAPTPHSYGHAYAVNLNDTVPDPLIHMSDIARPGRITEIGRAHV